MAYPSSLDTFTTVVDGVDDVMAAHHNSKATAIVAIETELGLNPRGSYADVAARLDRQDVIGADIYRASTSTADTASGTRTMTGFDATRRSDPGFTVNLGTGTITVPSDGYYIVEGHARLSAAYTGGQAQLNVNDGTNDVVRGGYFQSSTGGIIDIAVCGSTWWLTALTVLRLQVVTGTSTSLVGNTNGNYYYFRVVRL